MDNPLPLIVFFAVIAALIIVLAFLIRRPKKNRAQSRSAGRTNASDAGDSSAPLWFMAGGASHDSGHSGYSGGDSGGSDGGGGGGGE